MNYTPNYQLTQWEKDDRIQMEDFNGNNAKLDAAIKTNADAIAALGTSKANAATVTALGNRVSAVESGKASTADLSALGSRVGALESGKADASALTAETAAREAADTALQADINTRSRFVKLKEVTLAESTTRVDIDVSDIDWSQWQRIHLDINVGNGQQAELDGIAADGTEAIMDYLAGASLSNPSPRITLNPGCMPGRTLERFTTANNASYKPRITYQQLVGFSLTDTTFHAGGTFIIWGEV